ncbi:MAG: DUF1573 domain-containing protein [Prevotella sp.]
MNIKDILQFLPSGRLGGGFGGFGGFGCLLFLALPLSAQKLQVIDKTVDCGKVEYNKPVTATFKMKNKGGRKLLISDVRVSCGCLSAEYPKEEIPSGEDFVLKLTYDARQLGHFYKEACIYSNGTKEPVYLTMTGIVKEEVKDYSKAYPYKVGEIRVDKLDLEFDDVNRGDMPVEVINIVNEGSAVLEPNLMHLPPYLTAEASYEYLRPGEQGKITVTLHSDRIHDLGITQTTLHLANRKGDTVSPENEINASAVLLPSFSQLTETELLNAPRISLSEEEITMDFNNKDKSSAKVEITNTGKSLLVIRSLHMYSDALRVTLGKSELAPGQKTTLKITADRELMAKARTQPRVLMITNDPNKAKVVIKIKQ